MLLDFQNGNIYASVRAFFSDNSIMLAPGFRVVLNAFSVLGHLVHCEHQGVVVYVIYSYTKY